MEDTENVNDLYMEFKNGETKLNDTTLNQLQRLIKQDIQEHAGGDSIEIIQQNGTATNTNAYSADAINEILSEKMKLIFPVRFSIYNTSKY